MTLQEVLTELGIRFAEGGQHRHVRPGWIGMDCPWCGPGSEKFHLGLNLEGRYGRTATCFRCGPHRIGDSLALASGRPLREVLGLLGNTPGKAPSSALEGRRRAGRVKIPPGLKSALEGPFRGYLAGRGFDPEGVVSLWGVKALSGDAGRLAWRLWIPVRVAGEVVSWTTRAIGKRVPKYLSAGPDEEKLGHKTLLYGADLAPGPAVIVVEGPLDAWAVGPGAVATFGLSVTREQVAAIGKHPLRVICFDAEPEAQVRARLLARELESLPGSTRVVELETGKDPAEADRAELDELRRLLK